MSRTAKPRAKLPAKERRRIEAILRGLDRTYPDADCELDHQDAWQLLVATILSAQCTDERVNRVTPALFSTYPTPAALASADSEELEQLIRSTGFFRNKARSLLGAAAAVAADHGGEVPQTMEELLALPGVARKTANVVLGTAFGIAAGIVVDTHVRRVSQRLALTQHKDPKKIERELMDAVERERWIRFGHQLILHGRRICHARKPKCPGCPLAPHCPSSYLGMDSGS